jgi:hypothetical protein
MIDRWQWLRNVRPSGLHPRVNLLSRLQIQQDPAKSFPASFSGFKESD